MDALFMPVTELLPQRRCPLTYLLLVLSEGASREKKAARDVVFSLTLYGAARNTAVALVKQEAL